MAHPDDMPVQMGVLWWFTLASGTMPARCSMTSRNRIMAGDPFAPFHDVVLAAYRQAPAA
jgi:hypothetical protein